MSERVSAEERARQLDEGPNDAARAHAYAVLAAVRVIGKRKGFRPHEDPDRFHALWIRTTAEKIRAAEQAKAERVREKVEKRVESFTRGWSNRGREGAVKRNTAREILAHIRALDLED